MRRPPLAPVLFVGVLVLLASWTLVTGVVDVALPVLVEDMETFGILNALVSTFGPSYLFLHVLLHNLGVACIVPGIGLLAGRFERSKANRRIIATILLVAVSFSILVAVEYLIQAHERFKAEIALPLLILETMGVLGLAWPGYLAVRNFHPTPRVGWSLVAPANELAPWFMGSYVLMAVGALFEVAAFLGAVA